MEFAVLELSDVIAAIREVVRALARHGSSVKIALVACGGEFSGFPVVDSEAVLFVFFVLSVVDITILEDGRPLSLLEAVLKLSLVDSTRGFPEIGTEPVTLRLLELPLVVVSVCVELLPEA